MIENIRLLARTRKTFPCQIAGQVILYYISVLSLVFLGACSKRPAQGRAARAEGQIAVPVTAAPVEQKTTSVELSSFGTVEAYASVELKAQITGILTGVHFVEGQM